MKKLLVLILGCLLLAVSCKNATETVSSAEQSYPKLKIVNDTAKNSGFYITKVVLVNYVFEPLEILGGESMTFSLENGMPAGNKDIYIRVFYGSEGASRSLSIKKDILNGKTTVVRLSGSNGTYYIE